MASAQSLPDLVDSLRGDGAVALYPSAGRDTKAVTFTHPEFFAQRAVSVRAPTVFVYVDRNDQPPLTFEDKHTRLRCIGSVEEFVDGLPARILDLLWEIDRYESRALLAV